MSRIWHSLFLPEEVQWQRTIRQQVFHHLPESHYQDIKARQICEARWRFCANCMLQLDANSTHRDQASLVGGEQLQRMARSIGSDIIRRWLQQDGEDVWAIRPLSQLRPETSELLLESGVIAPEVPAEPEWVELAARLASDPMLFRKSPDLASWET